MNAQIHSQISAKQRGGSASDYYALHDFMDSSKEVESSNAHRMCFHHLWGIKQVMIPIFGHTIVNSDGLSVNIKDMLEQDHVMADYGNRFLPSLLDYIDLVADDPTDKDLIQQFDLENRSFYEVYPQVREHMLSPLAVTGSIKSLLLTHSSYWITSILPKIFKDIRVEIKDFSISPSVLFNRMRYADWLNNGKGSPPSFAKINEHRKSRAEKSLVRDIVFDGSRGGFSPIID